MAFNCHLICVCKQRIKTKNSQKLWMMLILFHVVSKQFGKLICGNVINWERLVANAAVHVMKLITSDHRLSIEHSTWLCSIFDITWCGVPLKYPIGPNSLWNWIVNHLWCGVYGSVFGSRITIFGIDSNFEIFHIHAISDRLYICIFTQVWPKICSVFIGCPNFVWVFVSKP